MLSNRSPSWLKKRRKNDSPLSYTTEEVGNYLLSYTAHKKSDDTYLISTIFEWTKFAFDTSKVHHIAYVLDASGSMNDPIHKESEDDAIMTQVDVPILVPQTNPTKIELVRKAILRAIEFILVTGIKVHLKIIIFTDSTKLVFDEILTAESAKILKQKFHEMYKADGYTDIHQAMKIIFHMMHDLKPEEKKEAKIFLFTDGENTKKENDKKVLDLVSASEYKNNIFTIGIGDPTDYNGELLTKISDRFRAGATGTELNDHIIGLAFGAVSQVAKRLSIQFPSNMDIRCPFELKKNKIELTNVNFAQKLVFFSRVLTPYFEFTLQLDDKKIEKKIQIIPTANKAFCQLDQNLTYTYCKTTTQFTEFMKTASQMKSDELLAKAKGFNMIVNKETSNPKNFVLKVYPLFESFAIIVNKYVEQVEGSQLKQALCSTPSIMSQIATGDFTRLTSGVVCQTLSGSVNDKSKIECIICQDKLRDTIFLPCSHLATCYDCFLKMGKDQKCPVCTEKVQLFGRCTVDEKNPQMMCMTCKKQTINTVLTKCNHVATCEGCAKVAMKNGCPWCKKGVDKYMKIYR